MREIPGYFQCPKSVSDKWNHDALVGVLRWLVAENNRCGLEAPQHIGKMAIESRNHGAITETGNADGFRFILGELYKRGHVDINEDDRHYYVRERLGESEIENILDSF